MNQTKSNRRRGKFRIAFEFLDNDWELLLKPMGEVVVVRAEALYASKVIEYLAYSNNFDEVEIGSEAPYYCVMFTKNKDGSLTHQWRKLDEVESQIE